MKATPVQEVAMHLRSGAGEAKRVSCSFGEVFDVIVDPPTAVADVPQPRRVSPCRVRPRSRYWCCSRRAICRPPRLRRLPGRSP